MLNGRRIRSRVGDDGRRVGWPAVVLLLCVVLSACAGAQRRTPPDAGDQAPSAAGEMDRDRQGQPVSMEELVRAAADAPRRQIEIGFALGRVGDAPQFAEALRTAAADGVRYVRAYGLFMPGDGDYSRLIEKLSVATRHGLEWFLTFSNFPYDLRPPPNARSSGPWRYPEDRRSRIVNYSNRYPPSSRDRYRAALESLVERLRGEFGDQRVRRWYFELGAESDAARFFWGTAEESLELYRLGAATLDSIDSELRIGGPGYTDSYLRMPQRRPAFQEVLREIEALPATDFTSVHVYSAKGGGPDSVPGALQDFWRNDGRTRVISEWNVTSRTSDRTERMLDSHEFLGHFLEILAASYRANVDMLIVFKLQDDPDNEGYQLGLFNRDGNAKQGYVDLRPLLGSFRSGVSVVRTRGVLAMRTGEFLVTMAEAEHVSLRTGKLDVVSSSVEGAESQVELSPGHWAVARIPGGDSGVAEAE